MPKCLRCSVDFSDPKHLEALLREFAKALSGLLEELDAHRKEDLKRRSEELALAMPPGMKEHMKEFG